MQTVASEECFIDQNGRFMDNENWRKEFKTDELVRNFDYVEKPKVFEYYPQYYHKTDKVKRLSPTKSTAVLC